MAKWKGALEGVAGMNRKFWFGRRVFLTGHTGFKGSWLALWLSRLGAKVSGFALSPSTSPNLSDLFGQAHFEQSIIADIRDRTAISQALQQIKPEIVFHLAAQPLVLESYQNPIWTYETNVMGTAYLLEGVRNCTSVKAVINVTTDKCYENREWVWGYRENESLGGYDPYSSSKACSELVTSAFRNSFFNSVEYARHGVAIATARAGNVIGGGDWAENRLVPDCMRALMEKKPVVLRNPRSIRPWQHVLEPLGGYLSLAEKLVNEGSGYAESWNFGPHDEDARPVEWIAQTLCEMWGEGASFETQQIEQPHEANYLKLDCSKAVQKLGWHPRWTLRQGLGKVVEWTKSFKNAEDVRALSLHQIQEYEESGGKAI